MDYSQFLYMRPELSLMGVIVFLFLFDLFANDGLRKFFQPLACLVMVIHIFVSLFPNGQQGEVFGGMYRYFDMAYLIKTILSAGTLVVIMQAGNWLNREDTQHKQGEFYTLLLFTLLGMFFMISSGHFLLFVLGLELASTPMACLIAFDKYKHHSAEAGAKFILSAMFSSGLMMYGISFLYGTTGTLYFSDMTPELTGSPLQIMALVFFFSGLGFKISLVPFHLWTADVYQGAPTNVTAYLSVISKSAAAFSLFVIFIKVFAPLLVVWQNMLYGIIIATITIGNLFALRQKNLKRLLAFSSISQAGYLALGIISGSSLGGTSMVYYMLVYLVANLAIFGVISIIEQRSDGKVNLEDYNGLYQTNPKLSLILTLALFSLAGIPPFSGFFSKFFIFMAAFEAGFKVLVFIALINTIMSLYYYLLIVKALFINPNDSPIAAFKSDGYTRMSLMVCLMGIILFGLVSSVYEGIQWFSWGL